MTPKDIKKIEQAPFEYALKTGYDPFLCKGFELYLKIVSIYCKENNISDSYFAYVKIAEDECFVEQILNELSVAADKYTLDLIEAIRSTYYRFHNLIRAILVKELCNLTYELAVKYIPTGKYRHYKGKEYKVVCISRHSETLEPMVVYQALYGNQEVWVRPAYMWGDCVKTENTLRFAKIEDEK